MPESALHPVRGCGSALACALAVLGGACDPAPRPLVGISTSARFVDAARLAISDAAESHGPLPVDTLVIPEATNSAVEAVGAATTFATTPGMLVVIGHSNSAASLAASQIYNEHHVVQIAPHSSAEVYSRAGPWSFRMVPPDGAQGGFLAARVAELVPDGGRVAILYVNDDYGRGLRSAFTAGLDAARHPVALEYPHTEEEGSAPESIASTVSALESSAPDILVWLGRATVLHRYLPSIRARLPDVPIIGGDALATASQHPNEDGLWDGVMYVDFLDLDATPELRDFARRYEERVGLEATGPDALTYDAMALVLAAVRAGAGTPEALRDHLASLGRDLPPYEGVTGPLHFDEDGDAERPYVIRTVGRSP